MVLRAHVLLPRLVRKRHAELLLDGSGGGDEQHRLGRRALPRLPSQLAPSRQRGLAPLVGDIVRDVLAQTLAVHRKI